MRGFLNAEMLAQATAKDQPPDALRRTSTMPDTPTLAHLDTSLAERTADRPGCAQVTPLPDSDSVNSAGKTNS